jgi:hypothetical protein
VSRAVATRVRRIAMSAVRLARAVKLRSRAMEAQAQGAGGVLSARLENAMSLDPRRVVALATRGARVMREARDTRVVQEKADISAALVMTTNAPNRLLLLVTNALKHL